MYVHTYIYVYIYTSTSLSALTRLETGRQVALKECAEKVRWLGTELQLERSTKSWNLTGVYHRHFETQKKFIGYPTVHLRFLVWRFKRLAFGTVRVFPTSPGKKDHDLWSHMVPVVMRNGPGYTSTKESWSHEWWDMVPTCIGMSISIHRFIDPVDRSRSISMVIIDSPTREHGRYRQFIRIHLRRITVDRGWWIKIRDNFVVDLIDDTCGKNERTIL